MKSLIFINKHHQKVVLKKVFSFVHKGSDNIVKNKTIFPILITVLFTFFLFACIPQKFISEEGTTVKKEATKETTQQKERKNPYADAKITTKIISSAHKTFGYDILLNGKPLVHQPSIPAMPGNDGFSTKEKAQKVADFVVKKIRNNEMPPTVTIEDLNKLGVLK
jgi:hypothetical protein